MDISGKMESSLYQVPPRPAYDRRAASDEFSLVDLGAVVYRRRYLILGFLGLALVIGGIAAWVKPYTYGYSTSIEIGTRLSAGSVVPLEPIDTVLTKIKENYIPLVLRDARNDHAPASNGAGINAEVPRNSGLIVLRSTGGREENATHARLHDAVVRHLVADHNRTVTVLRSNLELKVAEAVNKRAEMQDEGRLLEAQITRMGEDERLVLNEVKAMNQLITTAEAARLRALRETNDETRAMMLLMLMDEMRQNRTRRLELEKRAIVELPNERDALRKFLADNQRARSDQEKIIENVRLQITNLQETHAIAPTQQSLAPVGIRRAYILGLSIILGLIAGLIATFVVQTYGNVKRNLKERSDGERKDRSPTMVTDTLAAAPKVRHTEIA